MADPYSAARLDEIAHHPRHAAWVPIRRHFDVRAFGVNAWRGDAGAELIEEHDERDSGHEELYLVVDGHARFTVDADDVDAPKGTAIFVRDPSVQRTATAAADGTVVLSVGGRDGRAFEISEWETRWFEDAEPDR
jgi:hypothetical protein